MIHVVTFSSFSAMLLFRFIKMPFVILLVCKMCCSCCKKMTQEHVNAFLMQVIIQGFRSYRDQTIIEPFSPKHNIIGMYRYLPVPVMVKSIAALLSCYRFIIFTAVIICGLGAWFSVACSIVSLRDNELIIIHVRPYKSCYMTHYV